MPTPTFTAEEMLYIEKQFDLNASLLEERVRKSCETFMFFSKNAENDKINKALAEGILELTEAEIITNSIRKKIETWRKSVFG